MGRYRLPVLSFIALGAVLLASSGPLRAADSNFRRGDANGDGGVDISDGVQIFGFLFTGNAQVDCLDAADANDSGSLDLTDAIFIFGFLFTGGSEPPPPGARGCGADPTPDTLGCEESTECFTPPVDTDLRRAGHLLNRIAYGPSPGDLDHVREIGVQAYIEEQLDPGSIDESGNTLLRARESVLFTEKRPSVDTRVVAPHEIWRYRKGTSQPPADWKSLTFDDSGWPLGPTSIGYGDGDDMTVLDDMRRRADDPETPENEAQSGYVSVFLRKVFQLEDPSTVDDLILRIDYDDGFVAYLNGAEVARRNVSGINPSYLQTAAGGHEAGSTDEIDITSRKGLLRAGDNVLAIQAHNTNITSSDLTVDPELVSREFLPGEPIEVIRGIDELQQLIHIRGIYSRRQLQAVLAEFWENHFTTDAEKLVEYFDNLRNSDATDAMSEAQAESEAAQVEFLEYQFFHDNALGNFGDLLLYSATSPSMLVYLDSVLNVKGAANENYAREIFELFAMGVDNRYTQTDIEQCAKAFTGWSVCKVAPEEVQPFPDSARDPVVDCGVKFDDTIFLNLGSGWKYFKGTEEPTPDPGGGPTTAWTEVDYDDSAWTNGRTGIGYGDGDDATVLSDMRGGYLTVYLRREFTVSDPEQFENLILDLEYDDGYVAYLNGIEIGRSETMEGEGSPPPFDEDADDNHEVDDGTDVFNLNRFRTLLRPAPETNVLAIQVHNVNLDSSDLSMRPRLIDREILPGSMENGDPSGAWVFQFDPAKHDTSAKTIFSGTPYRIDIPAGRAGASGVTDALDIVDALVEHPSTAEFICIKLIQRFVSDDLTLPTFKDRTAPVELRALLADAIAAWFSTSPPGNIETVMRTILDPEERSGVFWSDLAYRSKVKTPVELINSSLRVLEANAAGSELPALNDDLGMNFFTRDDPDGWSELGFDWIDTATMLGRINFVRGLAENNDTDFRWGSLGYLDQRELDTAEEVLDFFDELMFQNTLPEENRSLLLEFLETDAIGNPRPLSRSNTTDFRTRVEEFVGLLLSLPQWQFQ